MKMIEKEKLRKTGIDILGDVSWGTHFCFFYQGKNDLNNILVPYFKTGLENNEFCMWIVSEPLTVKEAKSSLKKAVKNLDDYIAKGQMEILKYSQWYTKSGKFEVNRVLHGWAEKEEQVLKMGFDGLRAAGNISWLGKGDWKNLADYEARVNDAVGKYRVIAICSYPLDKCSASEIIEVADNHQFVLIRREDKWIVLESSERKKAEQQLKEQHHALAQKNIALKEILWQITEYKNKLISSLNNRLEKLVMPKLGRLKHKVNNRHRKSIELIEKNIRNMAGSFGLKMDDLVAALSPREIEVCDLIRDNLSNKTISRELDISAKTVETIRKTIRRKLKLRNKQVNLRSYLKSL